MQEGIAHRGDSGTTILKSTGEGGKRPWGPITIEFIDDDPEGTAKLRAIDAQFDRNFDWLVKHRDKIIPHARGKILAVANQEAHIADSLEAAWKWVEANHPDDRGGAILRYIYPTPGPRIYDTQSESYRLSAIGFRPENPSHCPRPLAES
jgi:hypothetical protein